MYPIQQVSASLYRCFGGQLFIDCARELLGAGDAYPTLTFSRSTFSDIFTSLAWQGQRSFAEEQTKIAADGGFVWVF